jgi:hypothetical protein
MPDLKHVGRHVNSKKRCVVAYRVIPQAPEYCLVVNSESLNAEEHDSLMQMLESNAGQTAYELAETMQRTRLPDGRNMLQTFHTQGKLLKTPTKDVEMTPNTQTVINLERLNQMIADQRGITVNDLSMGITSQEEKQQYMAANPEAAQEIEQETPQQDPAQAYSETANSDVLTDEKLAEQYRSQAKSLLTEAEALNKQADELDPPKKPAPKKTATSKTTKTPTSRSKKATTNG